MIPTYSLFVTQKQIRNRGQLNDMIEFVRSGGMFSRQSLVDFSEYNKELPLIEITEFEDGALYLHDGHHRAASIVLGGRDYLDPSEYRIRKFTYEDYINFNLSTGWWTPFDPRIEVRKHDFSTYKQQIRTLLQDDSSQQDVSQFILNNKDMYSENRNHILTLLDFVGSLNLD